MAKIGIQISSFKPLLTTPEGVLEVFRKVKALGYTYAQLQWIDPSVPDEAIRDALQESGLECLSTQEYYELYMADIDHVIRQNKMWGSKDICLSGIPKDMRSVEGINEMVSRMTPLLYRLKDEGITLSYHPRSQEFDLFDGVSGFDRIVDGMPDDMRICLDLFHTEKVGLDSAALIRKYDGRIDMVHFKDDRTFPDGTRELTPIGQGHINWQPIISAVNATRVQYALAEQETWLSDPYECFAQSYAYITGSGIEK